MLVGTWVFGGPAWSELTSEFLNNELMFETLFLMALPLSFYDRIPFASPSY
jgi:hypothetical protein